MSDQTNRSLPGAHQELSYRLLVQGVTDYAIYMLCLLYTSPSPRD